MMHNIKWFAILICICCTKYAFSQRAEVLTLPNIVDSIYKNNALLQAYQLSAESYKYKADAATAWMPPMVGAGTFMTPYPFQKINEPRDKGMIMFTAEQEIPGRSKILAKKQYITSLGAQEISSKNEMYNSLKAEAKNQYYRWLVAEHKIGILEKNGAIIEMMKKIETLRYPYNQSQLSEVYKAEAKLEENTNMIHMLHGEIESARIILNGLMNRQTELFFTIDTTSKLQPNKSSTDTALLAASRADIVRMNQNIQSMQLNIASMQLEKKPDFKIRFDNMYPIDAMMPKAFSIMGMVSIPIVPWASKMYKGEIKSMELTIESMEKQKAGMLIEKQSMLQGMYVEIESLQAHIAAQEKKIIPPLHKALDVYLINYKENKMQLTEVLETWEALTMMQLDVWNEKLKLYQTIAAYEKEVYKD